MKLQNREKITLTVGGILAFLIVYIAFFWIPTTKSIALEKKRLAKNQKNLIKLKSLLEKYQRIGKNGKKKFAGSLSAFVEKKAKEVGVTIAYIRPYGEDGSGVEVKVDEMPTEKIVKFLYEMEKNGIKIVRLNMRDYKGTGIWVVRFSLEGGE